MLARPLSVGRVLPMSGVEEGTRNAAVPDASSIQDAIRRRPDGMPVVQTQQGSKAKSDLDTLMFLAKSVGI